GRPSATQDVASPSIGRVLEVVRDVLEVSVAQEHAGVEELGAEDYVLHGLVCGAAKGIVNLRTSCGEALATLCGRDRSAPVLFHSASGDGAGTRLGSRTQDILGQRTKRRRRCRCRPSGVAHASPRPSGADMAGLMLERWAGESVAPV